jgi:hypothetical protein
MMPQWWGNGGSLAQFPENMYNDFASQYGPTHAAQMTLLEDFIYEAGFRNHTVIDPKLPAPSDDTSEEEVPFEDEDFDF